MTTVGIHERVYLSAAHHRIPRNPQPWIEISLVPLSADGPVTIRPGNIFPRFVSVTPPGTITPATAQFAFLSINSASSGRTIPYPLGLVIPAGPCYEDTDIIAWYFLPGGGVGGPNPPEEIIDTYSVSLGDFTQDVAFTVTSDPSLTTDANDVGEVPTTVAETVQTAASISTGEQFERWVFAPDGPSASEETLALPAGSNGYAWAMYDHSGPLVARLPSQVLQWNMLIGSLADGQLWVVTRGGLAPVPPRGGDLLAQLATLLSKGDEAGGLPVDPAFAKQTATTLAPASDAKDIGAPANKAPDLKQPKQPSPSRRI